MSKSTAVPTLFYMIGHPGAGKTTFAKRFAHMHNLIPLCADEIGVEIFQFPTFDAIERQHVIEEMNWRAANHLRDNQAVVYDAGVNTHRERQQLCVLAAKAGARAIGIWIAISPEIARERLRAPRTVGHLRVAFMATKSADDQFTKVISAFEAPLAAEDVWQISGTDRFEDQYAKMKHWLGSN